MIARADRITEYEEAEYEAGYDDGAKKRPSDKSRLSPDYWQGYVMGNLERGWRGE